MLKYNLGVAGKFLCFCAAIVVMPKLEVPTVKSFLILFILVLMYLLFDYMEFTSYNDDNDNDLGTV